MKNLISLTTLRISLLIDIEAESDENSGFDEDDDSDASDDDSDDKNDDNDYNIILNIKQLK